MNKDKTKVIWGLCLIVVALLFFGNAVDIWNVNLFFEGWWTLFIIIPCIIGLFTTNEVIGNLFGIIVGVILLCAAQDFIGWSSVGKIILPLLLLWLGVSLLFSKPFKNKKMVGSEKLNLTAIFSGQNARIKNENFSSGILTAIFGGVELDLKDAKITEDVYISATAIFGGIEIKVPSNVKVIIKGVNVFGGSSNKKDNTDKLTKTIYINNTCVFGGIEVK